MKWNLFFGFFWAVFTCYDLANGNWIFGSIELILTIYHFVLFNEKLNAKVGDDLSK